MMGKLEDAQAILEGLGLPAAQQNEISAYTLLSLCNVKEETKWRNATATSQTVTKNIMYFVRDNYGREYKPNTRETFRRQVLHQFEQAHVVLYNPDVPDLPTNSPKAHYRLTEAALTAIRKFGTSAWKRAAAKFQKDQGSLAATYRQRREMQRISLKLSDGREFSLSPGKHNEVQAAVIKEFAPNFAPGSTLLYLGDTADKLLIVDKERLAAHGVAFDHDKLPDVVLFDAEKNWLFLIEVVTSHGPVSKKRVIELEAMFKSTAGKIYVSAFPDMAEFKKFAKDIAWDTEVWLADVPEHLIHFNGDRFLGPR
ncbi:MAG TPA: BsuBI/PstI family type II restriction endonuclease [Syntrophobacteraceae bacterium]|nr:BsuBI/PstI family type II restriction endonuclease [Syntrophobacteraceae bacterium]